MPESALPNLPFWDQCVHELKVRHSRYRIRRHPGSPFIYVREMADGRKLGEFSLQPMRWCNRDDIEEARDLCIQGHRKGRWPATQSEEPTRGGSDWASLAEACVNDIKLRICKEGSRAHAINDLRKRIAVFRGPVEPQKLQAWVLEHDPRLQLKSFNRRIETLSQIHRSGLMDLTSVLQRLRDMRPKGAAEKIRKASSMRVRVIPSDEDLQHWLDRLEPFHQWVFGCIATYGLRPHELWHAEGIDSQGWISIPGDMKTKTGEHFAPAVPEAWVERYGLRENWERFHGQLNGRWKVRFAEVSGVRIAVNNVAVSNSLYKEFQRKGLQKLWAPVADGEGMDWVRPYDLRHAYAIRCATSAETSDAFDDDMATWMGYGLDVHRRIYLRWLISSRRKESLQRRRAGGGAAVNRIQPFEPVQAVLSPAPALPEGITPELLEMAMKLKAAGLG
jgi:integrase